MSYGKDERHIDKYVWDLPIPAYDPDEPRHRRLAELGHTLEGEVFALDLEEATHSPPCVDASASTSRPPRQASRPRSWSPSC